VYLGDIVNLIHSELFISGYGISSTISGGSEAGDERAWRME